MTMGHQKVLILNMTLEVRLERKQEQRALERLVFM
jgi:hypothetical protein